MIFFSNGWIKKIIATQVFLGYLELINHSLSFKSYICHKGIPVGKNLEIHGILSRSGGPKRLTIYFLEV